MSDVGNAQQAVQVDKRAKGFLLELGWGWEGGEKKNEDCLKKT